MIVGGTNLTGGWACRGRLVSNPHNSGALALVVGRDAARNFTSAIGADRASFFHCTLQNALADRFGRAGLPVMVNALATRTARVTVHTWLRSLPEVRSSPMTSPSPADDASSSPRHRLVVQWATTR